MKINWKNAGLAFLLGIVLYNLMKAILNIQAESPTQLYVGIVCIVTMYLAYQDFQKRKW